ncbi:LacI family transcriptional regulator [Silicimonas sp. MF1-12-2]|uniref:LacI family transcriptional regulator n=1 Tax=Silicimonas sp. MF1-12-2 TaxID=3384793 RepID=UPI0039B3AF79
MTDKIKLDDLLEPGERERPTLKTIARISGLAVPTVSRALSDAPDIGTKTKKRVRALADQLGYRPNRAGLRLRTGKTNVIALALHTEDDVMSHGFRLITAVATELRQTPYHVIITPYFPDEDPLAPIKYIVQTGSADGVIMNRIQPDDPRIAYLRKHKFPFAMHGRTRDCGDIPWFDFDNAAYSRRSIAIMQERGRKSMLLIAPPRDQNYAQHMIAAAEESGAKAGITVRVLEGTTSDGTSGTIKEAVVAHLLAHPDTDAIMSASVPAAVGGTLAVESLGKTIGREIDLIGKESRPFLEGFRRDILIVREDIAEAGQFLARAVLQAIDHPELPTMQKLVMPG